IAPTLASILVEHDPFLAMLPDFGIAHRLDNDTSGLMVVAKTNDALVLLSQQFRSPSPLPSRERERERGQFAVKEYTALVLGSPPNGGAIDDPIAHHPRKKAKMIVDDEGRPAKTDYTVTQRYRDYSLLTVTIATGVRHQIRVHLASAGFPLAGDRLYQNPKKRAIDTLPLQRHFLHASRLTITHPVTGKRRTWTSKLPDDLTTILSELS
ncbi:MAG: RNA pseudouridine synthase, partial [Deltaproteobacteria bacterium]|nr:RNA pseudouridine synthase [Deltaproteobacteria bacterium]